MINGHLSFDMYCMGLRDESVNTIETKALIPTKVPLTLFHQKLTNTAINTYYNQGFLMYKVLLTSQKLCEKIQNSCYNV